MQAQEFHLIRIFFESIFQEIIAVKSKEIGEYEKVNNMNFSIKAMTKKYSTKLLRDGNDS